VCIHGLYTKQNMMLGWFTLCEIELPRSDVFVAGAQAYCGEIWSAAMIVGRLVLPLAGFVRCCSRMRSRQPLPAQALRAPTDARSWNRTIRTGRTVAERLRALCWPPQWKQRGEEAGAGLRRRPRQPRDDVGGHEAMAAARRALRPLQP
jgi:hypothetical protein